jgi:hypothetical protein
MKNVMASASEAETGALFHNGQEIAHMRQILKDLDYEQPGPTRLITDNSTADGFANKRTKIKRSKAMDMRNLYWIQDRVQQGELAVHWLQGEDNLADYFTKHHPPAHHLQMRPIYLHTSQMALATTYGCRGVLSSPFPCMTEREPDSRYSGSLQQAKAVASRAALLVRTYSQCRPICFTSTLANAYY